MESGFDKRLVGFFGIKQPTIVLSMEDGRHVAHTLPAGSIVKVVDGKVCEKGLIDVVWKGKWVLMFAVDLQSRGEKMPDDM